MATNCTRALLSGENRQNPTYFMEKLMKKIYAFYDEQDLIDVTFKLSNPPAIVPAHRLILSAASPYFKELLKSDNGKVPVIEIDNIDSDTFELLVTFCYTGETLVTMANVGRMLKGAIILQLDDVIASCGDYLAEHMSDYTLERAYSLDRETQCALLKEKIVDYEMKKFIEISQTSYFLDFSAEKLQALIESNHLNVRCEEDVFRAVKRWYEFDVPTRQQKLPDLIECLRLTKFDSDFLIENIQSLPGCEVLALRAVSWISAPLNRSRISLRFTKPREELSGKSQETTVLAVRIEKDINIYQYDKTKDEWRTYADTKIDVEYYGVVFLEDSLIFIGGRGNSNKTNDVKSWNLRTEAWKLLPSMKEPRDFLCAVVLKSKIYAIGGYECTTNEESTNTVEMYSGGNEWKLVSRMRTPRAFAGAVALNDKIFVMGGLNDDGALKSVECYDPSTDIWTQCADMNEVHYWPGVAVLNGHIYVIGSYLAPKTVERYDPQLDKWTMICSLKVGQGGGIGCISMDNQIWAIGGCDSENSVSVYNPERNEWVEKTPLPEGGLFSCFNVPSALLERQ